MYSHNMVGSNDLDASKKFYDATFQAIGGKPGIVDDKGRLIDGQPATAGNGCTIGFAMEGPEQAKAWHDAGVAAGGTSIEDPPGVREGGFGSLYLAYLRDPSGNKLCALHRVV